MKLAWSAYGARPKSVSISNHSQIHNSTNKAIQRLGKEEVAVKTGLKERHASWVQDVNKEQQNWSRPEKIPGKTVTFEDGPNSHHAETTDPRPSEPKPYFQNVAIVSSNLSNNEQAEGNQTLLNQFDNGKLGVSAHASENLNGTKIGLQNSVSKTETHNDHIEVQGPIGH